MMGKMLLVVVLVYLGVLGLASLQVVGPGQAQTLVLLILLGVGAYVAFVRWRSWTRDRAASR
jgi:membrane protein DedA with SNARE-associated domain